MPTRYRTFPSHVTIRSRWITSMGLPEEPTFDIAELGLLVFPYCSDGEVGTLSRTRDLGLQSPSCGWSGRGPPCFPSPAILSSEPFVYAILPWPR